MQLLILYHLVTAKAAIALGGVGPRAEAEGAGEKEAAADEETAASEKDPADRVCSESASRDPRRRRRLGRR